MAGVFDKNAKLANAADFTSAGYTGAWFYMTPRTPYRGIPLEVSFDSAQTVSGSTAITPWIEFGYSADGGTTVLPGGTLMVFPILRVGSGGLAATDYSRVMRAITDYRQNCLRLRLTVSGGNTPTGKVSAGFIAADNHV